MKSISDSVGLGHDRNGDAKSNNNWPNVDAVTVEATVAEARLYLNSTSLAELDMILTEKGLILQKLFEAKSKEMNN